jgi:RNA polymerase sigma-70 factor (ECF subfamily)
MSAGNAAARDALIRHACERLRRLTGQILRESSPGVGGFEETDDMLQNAQLRLLQTLQALPPDSVAGFFTLATRAIRRELLDLKRHYFGPQRPGKHQAPANDAGHQTGTPPPTSAARPRHTNRAI